MTHITYLSVEGKVKGYMEQKGVLFLDMDLARCIMIAFMTNYSAIVLIKF